MTNHRTKRTALGTATTSLTTFDARDAKGRQIGCRAETGESEFTQQADSDARFTSYSTLAPGHYYSAKVQATRDGVTYGSSQPTSYFVTKDERDAYVEARIAASRKAALKAMEA